MRTVTLPVCLLSTLLALGAMWMFPSGALGVELRAVSAWPINHPVNAIYNRFLKEISDRSGGKISARLVGGPEVVAIRDGLKAAREGTIDILHGDPHYYGGELPITQIAAYLTPERGEIIKALRQPGAREFLQEETRRVANVIVLGYHYEQPFYIQTVKKAAIKPQDFKGLKLRSPGGLYAEVLKATGAVPVRISSPETYEALQRGVVDGTMRNTLSLRHFKEYEIIRYIMLPAFITARTMVVINANIWDKLPEETRKIIHETAVRFDQETVDYWWQKDDEDMKWLKKQGVVKTTKMSPEAIKILSRARVHAIDKLVELVGAEPGKKLRQYFGPYVK